MQGQGHCRSGIEDSVPRLLQHLDQRGGFLASCGAGPAQLAQVHHQKTQGHQSGHHRAAASQGCQGGLATTSESRGVAGSAVGHGLDQGEADVNDGHQQQAALHHRQPWAAVQGCGVGLELLRCQHRGEQANQMHQHEQHQQQSTEGGTQADKGCRDRGCRDGDQSRLDTSVTRSMLPDHGSRCDSSTALSWWVESRVAAARARCAASPSLVDCPGCRSICPHAGPGVGAAVAGAASRGRTFGCSCGD